MAETVQFAGVETHCERRRNPFGMRPPCAAGEPVCGYGDPNADFHVIGDHAGVHGGATTVIPFTGSTPGERLQGVLHEVGFLEAPYADDPALSNLFMNYLFSCSRPDGSRPTPTEYADHDRFFDAELRAVNAHILVPVGRRATDRVLEAYTTRARKVPPSMKDRHAIDVRGRGFLVLPVADPSCWHGKDRTDLVDALERILASDYRQTKGVATLFG